MYTAANGSSGGKGCGSSGATSGMKGGIGGGSGSGKGGSGGDRGGVGGGGDGENMDGFALCRKYRGHSILVQAAGGSKLTCSNESFLNPPGDLAYVKSRACYL